jgi:hypothetical protein
MIDGNGTVENSDNGDKQSSATASNHVVVSSEQSAPLVIDLQSSANRTADSEEQGSSGPAVEAVGDSSSILDCSASKPPETLDSSSSKVSSNIIMRLEPEVLAELIGTIEYQVESIREHLAKVTKEKADYIAKTVNLDPDAKKLIRLLMFLIRDILWPETPELKARGHPLESGTPIAIEEVRQIVQHLRLSVYEDVASVIDKLELMLWYYSVLVSLRSPPTTRRLRELIANPVIKKYPSDKMVKFIVGINNRLR